MINITPYKLPTKLVEANLKAIAKYMHREETKAQPVEEITVEQLKEEVVEKHVIEPVLGKYVTRNPGFKKELLALATLIQEYIKRDSVKRPLNILLAAEPGSGKSFLIEQLADTTSSEKEILFEEYHVAAFYTIDDLYGVFNRVQSHNLAGKIPVILFDEVDAKVENRYVMSTFLAPMWNGVFQRGRESFSLGKAIFVFAASNLIPAPTLEYVLGINEMNQMIEGHQSIDYQEYASEWSDKAEKNVLLMSTQPNGIEKCRDFIDRVDLLICIPPISEIFSGTDPGKEFTDLACLLVRKHFKKVNRIEQSAVMVLQKKLATTSSRRVAEKCVFCSSIHDEATFSFTHLPLRDQEEYREDADVKKLRGKYYDINILDVKG
ncbi:AAA family ATPase [Candidatus Bathyarchaeota archaeon]|nr:AAA family ATPase [Candidatus Bathyarchaeota archaeon]